MDKIFRTREFLTVGLAVAVLGIFVRPSHSEDIGTFTDNNDPSCLYHACSRIYKITTTGGDVTFPTTGMAGYQASYANYLDGGTSFIPPYAKPAQSFSTQALQDLLACIGSNPYVTDAKTTAPDGSSWDNNPLQFATPAARTCVMNYFGNQGIAATPVDTNLDWFHWTTTMTEVNVAGSNGNPVTLNVGLLIAEAQRGQIFLDQVLSNDLHPVTASVTTGNQTPNVVAAPVASQTIIKQPLSLNDGDVDPSGKVSITGEGIDNKTVALLFDGATQWGEDLPLNLTGSTAASFQLPSRQPPSGCPDVSCKAWALLVNEKTGATSQVYGLTWNSDQSKAGIVTASVAMPTVTAVPSQEDEMCTANPACPCGSNMSAPRHDGSGQCLCASCPAPIPVQQVVAPPPPPTVAAPVVPTPPTPTNKGNPSSQPDTAMAPPLLTNSGVTTSYEPWAIWFAGQNLTSGMQAQLYESGKFWKTVPSILSTDGTWGSFQVPSDAMPSGCNRNGQSCVMSIVLTGGSGNSNSFPITMPSVQ